MDHVHLTREQLQRLADRPGVANAHRINLPLGRRAAPRPVAAVYEEEVGVERLTKQQVRERAQDTHSAKLTALLDYYAGTTVPLDRVAEHLKMPLTKVADALRRRGRTS